MALTTAERNAARVFIERVQRAYGDVHADLKLRMIAEDPERMRAENREMIEKIYGGQMSPEQIEQACDGMMRDLEQAAAMSLSRYENFGWVSIMAGMKNEIEALLDKRGVALDQEVLFSTLRSGRVNAMAVATRAIPQRVIFFEDGIFGFANLMAKIVAQCFQPKGMENGMLTFSTGDDDIRKRAHDREIAARFFDLCTAYLVGGHPHMARPYLPDQSYMPISDMLRDAFEFFVFGHEYGHIVYKHFAGDSENRALSAIPSAPGDLAEDDETREIVLNWQKEFEADGLGAALLVQRANEQGFDFSLSYWGIDFFFCSIDILHRVAAAINGEQYQPTLSETHPPAPLRRKMLLDGARQSLGPEQTEAVDAAANLGQRLEMVFDELFLACEPVFQRMSQDGIRTAPQWRLSRAA